MEIGKESSDELLSFCGMILKRCLFEMSQNKDQADIVIMANILMTDLNQTFHRLTREDVTLAFHRGVRTGEQLAINPRTWCNWLNSQKLKSNATRINSAQLNEKLLIETKCSQVDLKEVLKGFLVLCIIEPYEQYCNDEEITLTGVNHIYEWLDKNGFIFIDEKEQQAIKREVQGMIKRGKMFVQNNAKKYHPQIMRREIAIINLFRDMKEMKVNLRVEILKMLDNE